MTIDLISNHPAVQDHNQPTRQAKEVVQRQDQLPTLSLRQAAVDYAKEGWAVLPLHSTFNKVCSCGKKSCPTPGKHPRTAHGVKDATRDLSMIEQWWTQWPDANIGLATGQVSGRVVLDVDVKKGKRGDLSLQALVDEHWALPETLQALTPTGGWHFVFQGPSGKMASPLNVRQGIDVLTEGRYFVAAPSAIHDVAYQWIITKPAAPCPPWVVDLANEGKSLQGISLTDVAKVIRELLPQGQERNGEWRVLCPFHDEKNPSFSVRLSDGIYHCFACDANGNLVTLYAKVKGVTEAEARWALGLAPSCIAELNEHHAVTKVGENRSFLPKPTIRFWNERILRYPVPATFGWNMAISMNGWAIHCVRSPWLMCG